LPEGVVVGAIVRDEELLMGSKKLVIESGDHVLMVLIDVGKIHEVEALFLENE
jgi:trk system potassium uptake protein TrkA